MRPGISLQEEEEERKTLGKTHQGVAGDLLDGAKCLFRNFRVGRQITLFMGTWQRQIQKVGFSGRQLVPLALLSPGSSWSTGRRGRAALQRALRGPPWGVLHAQLCHPDVLQGSQTGADSDSSFLATSRSSWFGDSPLTHTFGNLSTPGQKGGLHRAWEGALRVVRGTPR